MSFRSGTEPSSAAKPNETGPVVRDESTADSIWLEQTSQTRQARAARWMGWRLRGLVLLALAGSLGLFLLLRMWAAAPYLESSWRPVAGTGLELVSAGDPKLTPLVGRVMRSLGASTGVSMTADAALVQRSPRWVVDDQQRDHMLAQQRAISEALQAPTIRLNFDFHPPLDLVPVARGFGGLGIQFWILAALSLVLYLIAMVVLLARPNLGNTLYAVIALAQAGNLLLIGVESLGGLGLPLGLSDWILPLRIGCDMLTAGAVLHVCAVHPVRSPSAAAIGWAGWLCALSFAIWTSVHPTPRLWWAAQGMLMLYGALGIAVLSLTQRVRPHPFTVVLRRLGLAAEGTLALLTIAVGVASQGTPGQYTVATVGSVIWYVFFASLILLIPFLPRSQQVMREFAMLAGISTVATSLDLLFVAVFALGPFASLTLSLFLALGLYAGARHWLMQLLMGSTMPSAERMFDILYRIARDYELEPSKSVPHLARLLRELFDPLEVVRASRQLARTRVAGDGSMLVVPLPHWPRDGVDPDIGVLVLRYAQRGRRMFTDEDARLSDRIIEQLGRAVAHDRAVELGRREERTRIAQDLHDDIGARLLTLMYKAQDPEMEEYIRHTLQDLKTLTRGLAASTHRLSHAAAEWKADLTQRLVAVHCELVWTFNTDSDVDLGVVQWSALTRIMRELINNIISHAAATRVELSGAFERGKLTLVVSDDGVGRHPQNWSHGLGLGGVRKRVKLLGGEVRWRENSNRGIICELRVPLSSSAR